MKNIVEKPVAETVSDEAHVLITQQDTPQSVADVRKATLEDLKAAMGLRLSVQDHKLTIY